MRQRSYDQPKRRSTTLRMILMLVITGVIFGGLFGVQWMGGKMMNQMFDTMAMPPATVSVAEARTEIWSEGLEAVGTLVAVNGTDVTTESAGVVSAIRFESGQNVNKGDVLLQLDTTTEVANLRAVEASLRLAVSQRDRFRELYEGKQLVSKADLDERESEAERFQAEANAQRALIARKTIRAPFAGVLGIRKANLGQYLNPGDAIVSLQSLDPIYVHFTLPEQRLGGVQIGQPLSAEVDALTGQQFSGTVTAIEPQVEVATRNFMVQATVANPELSLRPGTFARVKAQIGAGAEVVVVPQTAIAFNPYGNAVWVIHDAAAAATAAPDGQAAAPVEVRAEEAAAASGEAQAAETAPPPADAPADAPAGAAAGEAPKLTVQQRFVKTGASRGDLIAITEGLKAGERVVTSGLLKLMPNAAVIIDNSVAPSAESAPTPDNS